MLPHAKALPVWPSAFVTPVLAPASASPVCLFGTSMAPSMLWLLCGSHFGLGRRPAYATLLDGMWRRHGSLHSEALAKETL